MDTQLLLKMNDKTIEKIDFHIESIMRNHNIAGLSLGITKDEETMISKGYGFSNLEHSILSNENTVYEIASITKVFTATLVMMEVNNKKIALEDPIKKYIPNLPENWQPITIKQLLTHTSGLPNYTSEKRYWETAKYDITREQILGLVVYKDLEFAPGSKWHYCNTGYYLLGILLEYINNKSYKELLEERIFIPLEMNSSYVNDRKAIIRNRASGYEWKNNNFWHVDYYSTSGTYSAGIILSTTEDLLKYANSLLQEKILPIKILEQIWHPYIYEEKHNFAMGLGWFIINHKFRNKQVPFYGHNGNNLGFSSDLLIIPSEKLVITILCNTTDIDANAITEQVLKFVE